MEALAVIGCDWRMKTAASEGTRSGDGEVEVLERSRKTRSADAFGSRSSGRSATYTRLCIFGAWLSSRALLPQTPQLLQTALYAEHRSVERIHSVHSTSSCSHGTDVRLIADGIIVGVQIQRRKKKVKVTGSCENNATPPCRDGFCAANGRHAN